MKICKLFNRLYMGIIFSAFFAGCGSKQADDAVTGQKPQQTLIKSDVKDKWEEAYIKYREQPADPRSAERVRAIARTVPANVDAQMALAVVERNSGNWAEAEAAFTSIIKRNPLNSSALWNLGRLAMRRGETELAADYFERSIKANPRAWQPVYALAQLVQQQGDIVSAKSMFAQAKSLGAGKTDRFGGMDAMKPTAEMAKELLEWD